MLGETIKEARKKRGWSLAKLGAAIGLTKGSLSSYENSESKSYNPKMLVKIADALNDLSILVHHCQRCPLRDYLVIKQFPDLNNINLQPGIVANRLRKEMVEGAAALDILAERFSDKDFKSRPDYQEIFEKEMEQVIDVKRGIEILEFELIMASVHSSKELQVVYDKQQAKCEAHGHHRAKV